MFPQYNGENLPWCIQLTFTDEREGYPRARAVIQAMIAHRPDQLERERMDALRGSFDRIFGRSAKRVLGLIDEEMAKATA